MKRFRVTMTVEVNDSEVPYFADGVNDIVAEALEYGGQPLGEDGETLNHLSYYDIVTKEIDADGKDKE